MHHAVPRTVSKRLAAVPWFVLALAAAFGLAISMNAVVLDESSIGFPTLWVRVFALIAGAIGVVRHLAGRGGGPRCWLGLPPRDWAFTAAFALVSTLGLWVAK